MRTSNPNTPSQDLFSQFNDSRLNYKEMFSVRGGDNENEDDELNQGSTADQQDDGFN